MTLVFYSLLGLLAAGACVFFFALQGYRVLGLCCLGLMGLMCFYRLGLRLAKKRKFVKAVMVVVTILLCIGLVVFAATEAVIIRASLGNSGESCDYLVVLGAKVNDGGPSRALRDRINAAYDYLMAHPDTVAVLSGGQGPDEPTTEALCMYNELVALGIDPARLLMEDQSTNTWENLKFTLALLEKKTGTVPTEIALISSEFHLYRAGLFARRLGLTAVGVPAETTLPVLKVNYFIREAVAVWYYLIFGGKIYG